jgi:hypothetical protein
LPRGSGHGEFAHHPPQLQGIYASAVVGSRNCHDDVLAFHYRNLVREQNEYFERRRRARRRRQAAWQLQHAEARTMRREVEAERERERRRSPPRRVPQPPLECTLRQPNQQSGQDEVFAAFPSIIARRNGSGSPSEVPADPKSLSTSEVQNETRFIAISPVGEGTPALETDPPALLPDIVGSSEAVPRENDDASAAGIDEAGKTSSDSIEGAAETAAHSEPFQSTDNSRPDAVAMAMPADPVNSPLLPSTSAIPVSNLSPPINRHPSPADIDSGVSPASVQVLDSNVALENESTHSPPAVLRRNSQGKARRALFLPACIPPSPHPRRRSKPISSPEPVPASPDIWILWDDEETRSWHRLLEIRMIGEPRKRATGRPPSRTALWIRSKTTENESANWRKAKLLYENGDSEEGQALYDDGKLVGLADRDGDDIEFRLSLESPERDAEEEKLGKDCKDKSDKTEQTDAINEGTGGAQLATASVNDQEGVTPESESDDHLPISSLMATDSNPGSKRNLNKRRARTRRQIWAEHAPLFANPPNSVLEEAGRLARERLGRVPSAQEIANILWNATDEDCKRLMDAELKQRGLTIRPSTVKGGGDGVFVKPHTSFAAGEPIMACKSRMKSRFIPKVSHVVVSLLTELQFVMSCSP